MNLLRRLFKAPNYDSLSLCELVALTVDSPGQGVNHVLVERLITSKVYTIPPKKFLTKAEGENVSPISKQGGPDGQVYFVVFCEINAIREEYPDWTIVELPGATVIELAIKAAVGVVVRTSKREFDSPAAVLPAATVASICDAVPRFEVPDPVRIYWAG